jgi:hypothetical protein
MMNTRHLNWTVSQLITLGSRTRNLATVRLRSKRKLALVIAVLAIATSVGPAQAAFWFEDFTDENISDSGINWLVKPNHTNLSNSPEGVVLNAELPYGTTASADWPVDRQGWSIRTKARLLQDYGLLGVGATQTPRSDGTQYTINAIQSNGRTLVGWGPTPDDWSDRVDTDLRPSEEDVILQFDTLDGVLRMWAWRPSEEPEQDIAPLIEKTVDLRNAVPFFWVNSSLGPSSAQFRWIAISTEHMPVDMQVPLSDMIGDFSGNDVLDVADIDLLAAAIQTGSVHPQYDLNHSGTVDLEDHAYWVSDLNRTWIGDANLDGEFNSGDLVDVFEAGRYETGEAVGWSQGDWNADGVFDSSDFTTAFQDGGYEMGARVAVAAVPEPSSSGLLLLGLLGAGRFRRAKSCLGQDD